MISGYVATEVRRTLRNQLTFTAAIMVVALAVPLVFASYVLECIQGPFPLTLDQIAAFQHAADAPHSYVRLAIDFHRLDNNSYYIRGGQEHKRDYFYFLHVDDDRFLIVQTISSDPPRIVEGGLVDWDGWNADHDIRDFVMPGIRGVIKGRPLPVVITHSYTEPFWVGTAILALVLLICLGHSIREYLTAWKPTSNRGLRQLARIGPPDEIALAIEAEVQARTDSIAGLLLTRSWIIRPSYFGTDYVYLGDVAWAYRHDESIPDGIKVGNRNASALILIELGGNRTVLMMASEAVDRLLDELVYRLPWVAIGFDADRHRHWTASPLEAVADIAAKREQALPNRPN